MSYKLFAYGTWFDTNDDGGYRWDREDMLAIVGEYDPEVIDECGTEEEAYRAWKNYETTRIDEYYPDGYSYDDEIPCVDVTFFALARCYDNFDEIEILEVSTSNYSREDLETL